MAQAPRDENRIPVLLGVSNSDGTTPVPIYADPVTNRLLVNSTGGSSSGTTTVSGTVAVSNTVNVAIVSGTVSVGTVTIGAISGTVVVSSGTVNIQQLNGTNISVNNGTTDAGTQRVTLSSDSTGQVKLAVGSNLVGTVSVNSIAAGSNTIGTVSVNSLPAVVNAAGSNTIGTVQVSVLPSIPAGSNTVGTVTVLPHALTAGSAIIGTVSINSLPAVTGTVNVNMTQLNGQVALSSGVNGSQAVGGDTANAATDAGNPVKIGGLGKTANPTAVSDGQRVAALFDKLGKQVVVGAVRDLKANQFTTINNSTAETTVISAAGANVFADIYGCLATNNAAAVNKIVFKDSTSGTTQFTIEVPATDSRGFMLSADSAVKQTTANNNWTATCGTSGSVEIAMFYVKNL